MSAKNTANVILQKIELLTDYSSVTDLLAEVYSRDVFAKFIAFLKDFPEDGTHEEIEDWMRQVVAHTLRTRVAYHCAPTLPINKAFETAFAQLLPYLKKKHLYDVLLSGAALDLSIYVLKPNEFFVAENSTTLNIPACFNQLTSSVSQLCYTHPDLIGQRLETIDLDRLRQHSPVTKEYFSNGKKEGDIRAVFAADRSVHDFYGDYGERVLFQYLQSTTNIYTLILAMPIEQVKKFIPAWLRCCEKHKKPVNEELTEELPVQFAIFNSQPIPEGFIEKLIEAVSSLNGLIMILKMLPYGHWETFIHKMPDAKLNQFVLLTETFSQDVFLAQLRSPMLYSKDDDVHNRAVKFCFVELYWRERRKGGEYTSSVTAGAKAVSRAMFGLLPAFVKEAGKATLPQQLTQQYVFKKQDKEFAVAVLKNFYASDEPLHTLTESMNKRVTNRTLSPIGRDAIFQGELGAIVTADPFAPKEAPRSAFVF